jgi:hypothetical protein
MPESVEQRLLVRRARKRVKGNDMYMTEIWNM